MSTVQQSEAIDLCVTDRFENSIEVQMKMEAMQRSPANENKIRSVSLSLLRVSVSSYEAKSAVQILFAP
jgi:hypothetical protein